MMNQRSSQAAFPQAES